MRKIIMLATIGAAVSFAGCNNAPGPSQSNSNATSQAANDHPQTMIAHSGENQAPPTGGKTKWSQGGNPIDTTELDAAVTNAEKELKAKPSDDAAKKAASQAYNKRAVALTDARQYASALGDYRKAVKLDPSNAEAKQWIDQITQIYESMNKEAPKEGEEPPALPFKK